MTLLIDVSEENRVGVGQLSEVVSIVLMGVFPLEVKGEVFSSEVGQWGFSLEL